MTQTYRWPTQPNPKKARPFSGLFSADGTVQHVADYLAKHYGTDFVNTFPAAVHEFHSMVFMGYSEDVCDIMIQSYYSTPKLAN